MWICYILLLLMVSAIALVAIIKVIALEEDLEEANERIAHLICKNVRLRIKKDGTEDSKD